MIALLIIAYIILGMLFGLFGYYLLCLMYKAEYKEHKGLRFEYWVTSNDKIETLIAMSLFWPFSLIIVLIFIFFKKTTKFIEEYTEVV